MIAAALVLEAAFRALGRRSSVIVVGPELAGRYRDARRLLEITVSLVDEGDLVAPEAAEARSYDGELRLIAVGRLDAEKNPLLIADVLRILVDGGRPWRLLVCGDGTLRGAARRSASRAGSGRTRRAARKRPVRPAPGRALPGQPRPPSHLVDRGPAAGPDRGVRRRGPGRRDRRGGHSRSDRRRGVPGRPGRAGRGGRRARVDRGQRRASQATHRRGEPLRRVADGWAPRSAASPSSCAAERYPLGASAGSEEARADSLSDEVVTARVDAIASRAGQSASRSQSCLLN